MIKYINTFLILFLGTLGIESCTEASSSASGESTAQRVETFALQHGKVSTNTIIPGELFGFRQVDLFAKVNSYVSKLNVDIGSRVRKGDLLVLLDAPEIASQLSAANSQLASLEVRYNASNDTYQRMLETSRVEGTISQNALTQAEAQKNSAYADFQGAKSRHKELQAMLDYLSIRAPFNGIVTSRNINLGAFVGTGSQTPLLSMTEQTKLRLVVSVPEAFVSYIKLGDSLSFTVNSLPGQSFKAPITRMAGALDVRLRAQRIELDIDNLNSSLLPGMITSVVLPLETQNEGIFSVPKSSVMTTTQGIFLIRVTDGKVNWVSVSTGLENLEAIEVFSNELMVNDAIVTNAAEEIRQGSSVEI